MLTDDEVRNYVDLFDLNFCKQPFEAVKYGVKRRKIERKIAIIARYLATPKRFINL